MFVSSQKFHYRPAPRRSSGTRKIFGFGKLVLFGAVACCALWLLFQQTVHRQLRNRVQAKISDGLRNSGLKAELGQARFHEGQGIQLNDLTFKLAAGSGELQSKIEIYEAFIHAPATMTELASSELQIQAVELKRVKITLSRDQNGEWDFQNVIGALAKLKPDSEVPIPVSLTDCELQVVDRSTQIRNPSNCPMSTYICSPECMKAEC